MAFYAYLSLSMNADCWNRVLRDSFYCPRKDGIIHDLNYCKFVCPRKGLRCEYLNNRKYLRYY